MSSVESPGIVHDRSLVLRVKGLLGHRNWRRLIGPVKAVLGVMPPSLLYRVGVRMRRNSYPYRLIQEGDTVVQVGAPRDLLRVGRSRAIVFAKMVGAQGRAIIFEPEPESVAAMRDFLREMKLEDRVTLIPKGAWFEEGELVFYANPDHPASNMAADVTDRDEADLLREGYEKIVIPVSAVDDVLAGLGGPAPRLVSVTTNGAEENILRGAAATLSRPDVHVAVAHTGPGLEEILDGHGYRKIATDDRGFTFAHRESA